MMDDPEYVRKALKKMASYIKSGYDLGEQFIFTFETKADPLDTKLLEKMLENYLQ